MILETLGLLATNEALSGTSETGLGYCLDLVSAYNKFGNSMFWFVLKTTVAADYTSQDETYQFFLKKGTGTDGTDIDTGAVTILETPAMDGDDARLDVAGDYILRVGVPYEASLRYLQWFYDFGGSSPTISVDCIVSPTPPVSDHGIQYHSSTIAAP